jgi:hypothetical protein
VSSSAFTSIIEKYFNRNGGWLRLKGELSVFYWPKVAGEEIAKKVEAVRYHDGYLYLQTEIPALAQQILLMIPSFLEKYQNYLGKKVLKGIKVKIGTIKHSTIPLYTSIDLSLAKEELTEIDNCKKQIADPELADKFSNFMSKTFIDHKKKKASGGKVCMSCGVAIDADFDYCPCCEHKVNEEIKAYLKYQKTHKPDLNQNDPRTLAGLSHLRIR